MMLDLPTPGSETMIGVMNSPTVLIAVLASSMETESVKLIFDMVLPLRFRGG